MDKSNKLRDQEFGKFAEHLAAEHYISQGYAILERNWRCKTVEVDIIAQKESVVVFVEVKARSGRDLHPLDAVDLKKMKKLSRGADIFLRNMKGNYEYRFDIFTLIGDFDNYQTEVYEDAFMSPLT